MSLQSPIHGKPLEIKVPNAKISLSHLEGVARDAKFRARGLLEHFTFLQAHINGLPIEYHGMNGIEMVVAVADLMECLQTTLERMAREARSAQV